MAKETAPKKKNDYTVEMFFDKRDGSDPIPWDHLTEREKKDIRQKMSANLSSAMSRYYQAHPEAFEARP